jgi:arsenate reductase
VDASQGRNGGRFRVLFLCIGNSCRSQMAEGWARALAPTVIQAWSAGTAPVELDQRAVRAMAECGVDISGQSSKSVGALRGMQFDCVATLCDRAREACPASQAAACVVHVSFDDPPRLAGGAADEEGAMAPYRRVRHEVRAFVESLRDALVGRCAGQRPQ